MATGTTKKRGGKTSEMDLMWITIQIPIIICNNNDILIIMIYTFGNNHIHHNIMSVVLLGMCTGLHRLSHVRSAITIVRIWAPGHFELSQEGSRHIIVQLWQRSGLSCPWFRDVLSPYIAPFLSAGLYVIYHNIHIIWSMSFLGVHLHNNCAIHATCYR